MGAYLAEELLKLQRKLITSIQAVAAYKGIELEGPESEDLRTGFRITIKQIDDDDPAAVTARVITVLKPKVMARRVFTINCWTKKFALGDIEPWSQKFHGKMTTSEDYRESEQEQFERWLHFILNDV